MNILLTESFGYSRQALSAYEKAGAVILCEKEDRATLLEKLKQTEVLVVRLQHRIDKELIDSAPLLRYIISPTTGLDHIDTDYAHSKNIRIISLKGETAFLESIPSTAEHTIGLILALAKNIPASAADVMQGHWNRDRYTGHNLRDKTIGIVGMGRVGKQVASIAHAIGMKIIYHDPENSASPYQRMPALSSLLTEADIISLHIPLSDATNGLLNKEAFEQMKKNTWIINTSRAGVWDESALLAKLESGNIAGAATDVLSGEPDITSEHPMIRYAGKYPERLIITPHTAGATEESMRTTEEFVAARFLSLLQTGN